MINKSALLTSTAVALFLAAAPAGAQMQQKGGEEKAAPSQQPATGGEQRVQQKETPQPKGPATGQTNVEPKGKGNAQGEMKTAPGATTQTEPKEKANKGTVQTQPKEQGNKGAQTQPKDQGTKGNAQAPQPNEGKAAGKDAAPKASDTAKGPGSGSRVQLSEQQRTNVHSTILKDSNVNRATNVNFSISVGTRVPRSVRLVALPAAIIEVVPGYRGYHYVLVDDQICIVEPSTYEIIDVIPASGRSASVDNRGGSAKLVLTEEEKTLILREVNMGERSTLALGSLSEGSDVPRDVQVRAFPETVVQKVPKVREYKFFAAENRVAIVDPQGSKVQLIIEDRR